MPMVTQVWIAAMAIDVVVVVAQLLVDAARVASDQKEQQEPTHSIAKDHPEQQHEEDPQEQFWTNYVQRRLENWVQLLEGAEENASLFTVSDFTGTGHFLLRLKPPPLNKG